MMLRRTPRCVGCLGPRAAREIELRGSPAVLKIVPESAPSLHKSIDQVIARRKGMLVRSLAIWRIT